MTATSALFDSRALASSLVRGWWIVLAAVMLSLLAAVILTGGQEPVFQASAMLVVIPSPENRDTGELIRSIDTLERRTVVATLARIPAARETKAAAASRLGLVENNLRRYRITASVVPNTNIIRIDVEGPDGKMAANVANAAGAVTDAEARSLYRIFALRSLARAVPVARPIRPDKTRNYGVALVIGLLAGAAAAMSWPPIARRLRQSR